MVTELIARKVGMTQIYRESGQCIAVTVLEAGPCTITQIKTTEKDGYNALQVAFGARKKKPRNVTRARIGVLTPRKADQNPEARKKDIDKAVKDLKTIPTAVRELPWDGKEEFKVGDEIKVDIFDEIKKVDIIGLSKGHGFNSAIARWGYGRQPASRGSQNKERQPGSLSGGVEGGATGGVVKGKKMAGHWGQEKVTLRNINVSHIDKDRNLIAVEGGVPGANGDIVVVKEANWVAPKPNLTVSKKRGKK